MNGDKFERSILHDPDYDRYKFVNEVSDLIEKRSDEEIRTCVLFDKVFDLEQQHKDLAFVQNVQKLNLDIEVRTLLYEMCDDFLAGDETGVACTMKDMYEHPSSRFRVAKALKEERHILQKLEYVELLPDNMFSDSHITLTEKGKKVFLEDDFDLFDATKRKNQNLIYPDKIAEKPMFYDKELERQLNLFRQNLEADKFADLQKRMADNALPKGVIALFHGLPSHAHDLRTDEAHHRQGGHRLAGARLAHDAEGFALRQLQRHVVQNVFPLLIIFEVEGKVADGQYVRVHL